MKAVLIAILISTVFLSLISCKGKEKEDKEPFFPVLSYLKSQVADIDTSLYSIRKLITVDSLKTDTIYIHRENFRDEAKDFLSVPDISSPAYRNRYVEEKLFDETLNRVLLTYTPLNPDKEEIQRQEVLIKPDPSGDKVTNIIINSVINTRDSSVQKNLLWKVGESFQTTITKQLAGQPEKTATVKVIWSGDEQQ
jgi:hypothetical protein